MSDGTWLIDIETVRELHIEIASLTQRVKLTEAERDIYRAALEEIARSIDCIGPGCPYCEDEDSPHPPSHEALRAQRALDHE